MSIEYRLTLAGAISLDLLAEIAAPGAVDLPTAPDDSRVLTSAPHQDSGYLVTILSGKNGYYDAEDGDTHWEWEPPEYVNVSFDMDKDDPSKGLPEVLATVARVLVERTEDAALMLNGNWVLLTRVNGTLRKHRPQWWANYGLDHLIPWSTTTSSPRSLS